MDVMRIFIYCIVGVTGLLGLAISVSCQNRDTDTVLTRRTSLFINERSIQETLGLLSGLAKIRLGFVDADSGNEVPKNISMKMVNVSVQEVLNKIVELDNRYRWKVDGGVINVYPEPNNGKSAELLRTRISSVNLTGIHTDEVGGFLLDREEIRSKLSDCRLTKDTGLKYSGPARANPELSVSLVNATIPEILNEVLRTSNAHFWHFDIHGGEFVTITVL